MKYAIATFRGRKIGAIGSCYHQVDITFGENEKEFQNNLYDKYEHISFPRFFEIDKATYNERKAAIYPVSGRNSY